jgi:protein TonB
VLLEATIDEKGNVTNLSVLRSVPLLDRAAIEAVAQWKYEPTLLNGRPVPILMSVSVRFELDR